MLKCDCGADLTKPKSVNRKYVGEDDDEEYTTEIEDIVFCNGHYDNNEGFEPDEKCDLSGGNFDTYDGCDTCNNCKAVVG